MCKPLSLAAFGASLTWCRGAVVGFVGGSYDGWEQYDWNALTHLGFWTEPGSDVRAMAEQHGVKLFRDHGSGCSIDCYTNDSEKEAAVQKILSDVQQNNLDGVFFDEERSGFEMSKKQRDGYADFVKRASDALQPLGKTVFVCVAGRPSYEFRNYDYGPMAEASEFLFVMGYDMHFWDDYSCVLNGECSPAEAAYPDVSDGVTQYLKQVPGSKLVLGLPWYGQRYTVVVLPFNEGQVDYKDVLRYQQESKIKKLTLMDKDKSWKLECKGTCDPDGKNKGGTVWFDDAETLAPKYQLARDNGLLGVGVWKIDSLPYDGSHDEERDAMWAALAAWNDAEVELV